MLVSDLVDADGRLYRPVRQRLLSDDRGRRQDIPPRLSQESERVHQVPIGRHDADPMPFNQGGQVIPDVVGNLRVEQAWGEAQFRRPDAGWRTATARTGAGRSRAACPSICRCSARMTMCTPAAPSARAPSATSLGQDQASAASSTRCRAAGERLHPQPGQRQDQADRRLERERLASCTTSTRIGGSPSRVRMRTWTTTARSLGLNRKYDPDWTAGQFAGQPIWSPVRNLDIGFEARLHAFFDPAQNFRSDAGGYTGTSGRERTWGGRVRVERMF